MFVQPTKEPQTVKASTSKIAQNFDTNQTFSSEIPSKYGLSVRNQKYQIFIG